MKTGKHEEESKTTATATDTNHEHSASESSVETSDSSTEGKQKPSVNEYIQERLQSISEKSPLELTVFDLTFLFAAEFPLRKIHGVLHGFNGKHYYPLDRQALEAKILEVLFDLLDKRGDIRAVRSIVYITERMPIKDYEESSDWIGFANGVLNIKSWLFFEYPQLKMRIGASKSINFPQPLTSPQTPPEPPIITYNLQASFDWTWTSLHIPTPNADKFFYEITGNDPVLITRIYEMIGYLLVPDTAAKSFFLLQGVPDSGKSVLGRFLEGFFPPQCVTALDISRLGGKFLPEALSTSRLNLSMDLPDGLLSKKAIAIIKMLTGNDLITHEVKYKDAKPFRGQCKFLFSINGTLKMTSRDTAFLDRIVCIPFRHSVPKSRRDEFLLTKLNNEREGIMMKALNYYRAFVSRNRIFSGENNYSPDVEYRLSPNDTIIEFVNEDCIFCPEHYTSTENLFSAYTAFCVKNQLRYVTSKSGFSQRLSSLYATQITPYRNHRSKDDNHHGYFGIAVSGGYAQISKEITEQKPFDEYDESDDYIEEFDDNEDTGMTYDEQE